MKSEQLMASIKWLPSISSLYCRWLGVLTGPEQRANSLQTNNFAPTKLSIVPVQRHKVQLLRSGAALVKLDIDHYMFFVMGGSEKT